MTIEKTPHNHKEVNESRRLEQRFIKANSVLKTIRRSSELHEILDHEGIRNSREFPDVVQIDLASGSVTSVSCLDFLFGNDATLSSKAKKVLLQIGKDRQMANLVSKIWSRSAVGVPITSVAGDGTRTGRKLAAYKRLVEGRR